MSYPYDYKRSCSYCGTLDWDSCFTNSRCRSCHRKYIEEEYKKLHSKQDD